MVLGLGSSGQCACFLLWRLEFETRRCQLTVLTVAMFVNTKGKEKEAGADSSCKILEIFFLHQFVNSHSHKIWLRWDRKAILFRQNFTFSEATDESKLTIKMIKNLGTLALNMLSFTEAKRVSKWTSLEQEPNSYKTNLLLTKPLWLSQS